MIFRKDNRILYGQDFRFFRGIPSGVDFAVEEERSGIFVLTAHGYGLRRKSYLQAGDAYGCGSLYVSVRSLTTKQRKRLEQEAKQDDES